jgi:hypothetical protein
VEDVEHSIHPEDEVICSYDILVTTYATTQHYNQGNYNLQEYLYLHTYHIPSSNGALVIVFNIQRSITKIIFQDHILSGASVATNHRFVHQPCDN